ncbi:hypothetical protein BALU111458_06875 [Bacillus luti]
MWWISGKIIGYWKHIVLVSNEMYFNEYVNSLLTIKIGRLLTLEGKRA